MPQGIITVVPCAVFSLATLPVESEGDGPIRALRIVDSVQPLANLTPPK